MTGLMLKLGRQSIDDGLRLEELSDTNLVACRTGVMAEGLVDTDTSSPYAVPSGCDGKVVPYKIGIAPDNAFTRNYFAETMDMWYPRVNLLNSTTETLAIPSFKESVQFFDSNDALTEYVKSDNYGDNLDNPKIVAAIVFDTAPSGDDIGTFGSIEYSLRLNSTQGDDRDSVGRVPTTDGSLDDVDLFQKDIVTDYYSVYTVTGKADTDDTRAADANVARSTHFHTSNTRNPHTHARHTEQAERLGHLLLGVCAA